MPCSLLPIQLSGDLEQERALRARLEQENQQLRLTLTQTQQLLEDSRHTTESLEEEIHMKEQVIDELAEKFAALTHDVQLKQEQAASSSSAIQRQEGPDRDDQVGLHHNIPTCILRIDSVAIG